MNRQTLSRLYLIAALAVLLALTLPLLALAPYAVPAADDYSYGTETHRAWQESGSVPAAVAAAVYRFRECRDTLRTNGRFAPNRLVYALACGELRIRQGDFLYRLSAGEDGILTVSG